MKTAEEIERIVREVVSRLTSGQAHEALHTEELQVSDRVITLSSIEGKLSDIKQLVVHAKAIVTPSVRDELRSNNIQLVRHDEINANPTQTATGRLLVANLGTANISPAIMNLPCEVETVSLSSLEATLATMTRELTDSTMGVIFSDRPEAAVCLANRSAKVNAFVGHSSEAIHRATATMNANLLVLDAATNNFTTMDLLRTFVTRT